jgi:hypothetical protein
MGRSVFMLDGPRNLSVRTPGQKLGNGVASKLLDA